MKLSRPLRLSMLAATVAGAALASTPALAGVSATAGVANLYLWRGQNLGGGVPVVQGSLDYSHDSGVFAGVWGSSGDASWGTEVDLYGGYAYSSDAFSLKATFWDYSYPRSSYSKLVEDPANPGQVLTETGKYGGDLQDVQLSIVVGGLFADAYIGVGDNEDKFYYDLGYTLDKFTAKLGYMATDDVTPDSNYLHGDLTFAYNERLAFTVSGILDEDEASPFGSSNKDALFVVSYTLPLELK